ncbi:MAG: hypothetical protein GF311_23200 [Candidatus Lokiarchaeota archaeon]|nr:hypothetical protein [Candidatus Lokiarchaeota archaeon]
MAWKGFAWSFVFVLSGLIFSVIPTYLIVAFWQWLNSLTLNGEPIYTLSLFMLFLWIVCLLIAVIYFVASVRAIVQRKNEDLGIPKGVKGFGVGAVLLIITFMVLWYIFMNEIAFFAWRPPA